MYSPVSPNERVQLSFQFEGTIGAPFQLFWITDIFLSFKNNPYNFHVNLETLNFYQPKFSIYDQDGKLHNQKEVSNKLSVSAEKLRSISLTIIALKKKLREYDLTTPFNTVEKSYDKKVPPVFPNIPFDFGQRLKQTERLEMQVPVKFPEQLNPGECYRLHVTVSHNLMMYARLVAEPGPQ